MMRADPSDMALGGDDLVEVGVDVVTVFGTEERLKLAKLGSCQGLDGAQDILSNDMATRTIRRGGDIVFANVLEVVNDKVGLTDKVLRDIANQPRCVVESLDEPKLGKDRDGNSCGHDGVFEKIHKRDDLLAILAEELSGALQFVSSVVGDMHLRVASMGPALVVITFAQEVDLELLDKVTLFLHWQDDEQTWSGELEQFVSLPLDTLNLLLDEPKALEDFLVSLLDMLLGFLVCMLNMLMDVLGALLDMLAGVLGTLLNMMLDMLGALLEFLANKVLECGKPLSMMCMAEAV